MEFIEADREDGRPFFAYIPFQAVHIPVQAPGNLRSAIAESTTVAGTPSGSCGVLVLPSWG